MNSIGDTLSEAYVPMDHGIQSASQYILVSIGSVCLERARSGMRSYYSSGSFVQTKQAPEFGGSNTDIGSTIVELLEVAESDFTRLSRKTAFGDCITGFCGW